MKIETLAAWASILNSAIGIARWIRSPDFTSFCVAVKRFLHKLLCDNETEDSENSDDSNRWCDGRPHDFTLLDTTALVCRCDCFFLGAVAFSLRVLILYRIHLRPQQYRQSNNARVAA